jgi:hypothetical protein
MKTVLGHICKAGATRLLCRYGLASPLAVLLGLTLQLSTARADTIFVTNLDNLEIGAGTIGEYTTDGATVNPALISGLSEPYGIAVSGSNLFVTNFDTGTIGEYTTDGATVNRALISGLSLPYAIAVSGSDLFVTNIFPPVDTGTIGKYTTDGATVNPALISGLFGPAGIAIVPTVAPEPSSFLLLVSGGLAVMIISIIRSARRMALARATKGEARLTAFNIEARREASLPSGA